ncbi:MAG: hypothetical protein J6V54_04565 [Bacteroidales bacterium]|nr:hypothetical protein [Bacteroidales bacterium]
MIKKLMRYRAIPDDMFILSTGYCNNFQIEKQMQNYGILPLFLWQKR